MEARVASRRISSSMEGVKSNSGKSILWNQEASASSSESSDFKCNGGVTVTVGVLGAMCEDRNRNRGDGVWWRCLKGEMLALDCMEKDCEGRTKNPRMKRRWKHTIPKQRGSMF